jgi:hypothetical protein
MDIKQSLNKAKEIPSLGCGGRSIGGYLYNAAKSLDYDCSIVEVGPWLGSATAFLVLGAQQSKCNISLYCYDKWIADEIYRSRAKRFHGLDFQKNEDILPYFLNNIEQFGRPIPNILRGDFKDVKFYSGKKIGIAVMDAGCQIETNNNFMKVFSNHFIPNSTLVLMMDYYFYERKDNAYKTQYLMMKKNKDRFKFLWRIGKSKTAAFKYLGGEVRYLNENDYQGDSNGSNI